MYTVVVHTLVFTAAVLYVKIIQINSFCRVTLCSNINAISCCVSLIVEWFLTLQYYYPWPAFNGNASGCRFSVVIISANFVAR